MKIFKLLLIAVFLFLIPAFAISANEEILVLGFNEGAGNPIIDSSSYAHYVATSGTVVWTASGKYGGAYEIPLDYTAKKIVVSDHSVLDLTGDFTIMAWIYPSDTPSDYLTIISKSTDDTDSWTFRTTSYGPLELVVGDGTVAAWPRSTGTVTYNAWNHVAVSLNTDTDQVNFYINGDSRGARSYNRDVSANTNDVTIGSRPNNVNKYNGRIDEVRIFNTALSQSQIQSYMNTPIGDACTDYDGDHYYPQSSGCDSEPGFLGYGDCDDSNSEIHPYAPEVCGNGVDENCDGYDLQCNDTIPPVRSNGQPSGSLQAGTTQTTLSLSTNEAATCKYSTTAGVFYDSMPNTFSTTGNISHSQLISGLVAGPSYAFYVKCKDVLDNKNSDDFAITFSVISCTDADGDHFYVESSDCSSEPGFQGYGDCDDSNASIHPGATDICGNGIDEDCSGQDLQCGQIPENSYYVSSDGNNNNSGSIDQPWKTIQKAADTVAGGDTVYIRAGIYNERVALEYKENSSGPYITFTNYPGEEVILDGTGISIQYGGGLFHVWKTDYIRVQGLKIQNSNGAGIYIGYANNIEVMDNQTDITTKSGVGIWGSSNVVVANNDIAHMCGVGDQFIPTCSEENISIAGSHEVVVRGNHVHDGPVVPGGYAGAEGINVKDGSYNVNIYNNVVQDLQKLAFGVDAWTHHTYNIKFWNNTAANCSYGFILESEQGGLAEDLWVYNNIAYGMQNAGYSTPEWGIAGPVQNVYFINNVGYDNVYGFWAKHTNIKNVTVRNNIFSQNSYSSQIRLTSGSEDQVIIDHNLFYGNTNGPLGSDYVIGNPLFVNPGAYDFHIQSSSPAIDVASSLNAPATDRDGNSRPQGSGYDIGAFEYLSDSPPELPEDGDDDGDENGDDGDGNGGGGGGGNPPSDTTAPVCSNFKAINITQNSVTITWNSNEATTSKVSYGPSTNYTSQTTEDVILRTSHSITIYNLQSSTTYHYQVVSKDGASNQCSLGDSTFTTLAQGQEYTPLQQYQEGSLLRAQGDFRVYIIKGNYKRHIFNPAIFNMYRHFSWNSIIETTKEIIDSYITSDLYRAIDDPRVYSLEEVDEINGKAIKHHLNMTPAQFTNKGYDWNQVFIVNSEERDYYETGEDLLGD